MMEGVPDPPKTGSDLSTCQLDDVSETAGWSPRFDGDEG